MWFIKIFYLCILELFGRPDIDFESTAMPWPILAQFLVVYTILPKFEVPYGSHSFNKYFNFF